MRIAQVAPLVESVPPNYYGGTERIVSYLTEELVRTGHDVTLFASGDSITAAHLSAVCDHSLRGSNTDQLFYHTLMVEQVFQRSCEFDIIHFHTDHLHFPLSRRMKTPDLTTLHGRLDIPAMQAFYREFSDVPVVSISDAQRYPLPSARWIATVYHGIPGDLYKYYDKPDDYLAFLGRISPEKNLDLAVEMARKLRRPLKIAAKVDQVDEVYFHSKIEPLLAGPGTEYLGELNDKDKNEFLGRAMALIFPIDWPEPFGLVMIESLACGTPVIAYRRGSVPEVLDHDLTGCIVESVEEAISVSNGSCQPSRQRCREIFEARFTVERMTIDYLAAYQKVIDSYVR